MALVFGGGRSGGVAISAASGGVGGRGPRGWRVPVPAVGVLILILILALDPAPARGQVILGAASSQEDGRPLGGAVVVGLDSLGVRVGGTLTDDQGRYRLQLPGPGRYRIRLERIGFRTLESGPHDVTAAAPTRVDLQVSEEAVALEGIVAVAEQRCLVRPEEGEATAVLWDEIRKALTANQVTEADAAFRFDLVRYRRRLNVQDLSVESEERERSRQVSSSPILSLPPDSLSARGYVRGTPQEGYEFFGPDAPVLLSESFLDDHCFTVREPDRATDPPLIGLGFEPVPGRDLPDIQGTLWVDASTSRLSHLEFTYSYLPYLGPDGRLGGRVDFEGLPNGNWIVRSWWIRMPVLARGLSPSSPGRIETTTVGLWEEGAEVTRVRSLSGAAVGAPRPMGTAAVRGVVWDSLSGAPLAGARVFVSGTQFEGTTGPDGSFEILGLAPGSYTLASSHPDLDLRGLPPLRMRVELDRDGEAEVRLAVPSLTSLTAEQCPADPTERARWDRDASVLGGVVEAGEGWAVAGSRLQVLWSEVRVAPGGVTRGVEQSPEGFEAILPSGGRFRFCGLPPERALTVRLLPPTGSEGGGAPEPLAEVRILLAPAVWGGLRARMGDPVGWEMGPGVRTAPGG